jgi:hypothetical protein
MSTTPKPTVYVNVFRFDNTDMSLERPVLTMRAAAVEDAEEHADDYVYTLTDQGRIDLEPEFSERWHEQKDFDAAVDARNDEMRELSSFTMTARA